MLIVAFNSAVDLTAEQRQHIGAEIIKAVLAVAGVAGAHCQVLQVRYTLHIEADLTEPNKQN